MVAESSVSLEKEMRPKPLKKVDWRVDHDLGPQAAINHDLKLLQQAIEHVTSGAESHGYYPVESSQYTGILIPDERPYEYRPGDGEKPKTIAIALGDTMVITEPGNPEKSLTFTMGTAMKGGTEIVVTKKGDVDPDFHRTVVTNPEEYQAGVRLRAKAAGTAGTFQSFSVMQDAQAHLAAGREERSYDFIKLSPSTLDEKGREVALSGTLSLQILEIKQNLLIVTTDSPFDIQVAASAPTK